MFQTFSKPGNLLFDTDSHRLPFFHWHFVTAGIIFLPHNTILKSRKASPGWNEKGLMKLCSHQQKRESSVQSNCHFTFGSLLVYRLPLLQLNLSHLLWLRLLFLWLQSLDGKPCCPAWHKLILHVPTLFWNKSQPKRELGGYQTLWNLSTQSCKHWALRKRHALNDNTCS